MLLFAFDLDSTITTAEMFPLLAEKVGRQAEMRRLTDDVLAGRVPLADSLRRRVELLAAVPLSVARRTLLDVPRDPAVEAFILAHRERCAVITANLDIWVAPLLDHLGCRGFTSRAVWENGRARLLEVVDKRAAARALRKEGGRLAAVGDSAADVPMLEEADYGFAHAGVHEPPACLVRAAMAVTPDGSSLCRRLEELIERDS